MEGVGAISGLRQRAEAQSSPAGCLCNRGLVITAKALLRFQEHHLTYILLHSGYTREQLYTFPLHRPTVRLHIADCTPHSTKRTLFNVKNVVHTRTKALLWIWKHVFHIPTRSAQYTLVATIICTSHCRYCVVAFKTLICKHCLYFSPDLLSKSWLSGTLHCFCGFGTCNIRVSIKLPLYC